VDGGKFIITAQVEAVEGGRLLPGFMGREEAGFDEVGTAVFGAEDVAVAAVVAEVGEVGDLVLGVEGEGSGLGGGPLVVIVSEDGNGDFTGGESEAEVGVVGADGEAFIAGEAVEEFEMGSDFLWTPGILGV